MYSNCYDNIWETESEVKKYTKLKSVKKLFFKIYFLFILTYKQDEIHDIVNRTENYLNIYICNPVRSHKRN